MPRQQGLLRRGGRYYCNIKVPKMLREALGKEHIREALKTSDYREACRRVVYENMRWKGFFEEEQRKAATLAASLASPKPRLIVHLSEREAHEIAARHLIRLERQFRQWWEDEGRLLEACDRQEVLFSVADELAALEGNSDIAASKDAISVIRPLLEHEGMICPPTSPAFKMLRPLLRAALAEHASRKLDVLELRSVQARDTHFRELFAHSAAPQRRVAHTLDDLLKRLANAQREDELAPGTLMTYELPARILREIIGSDTALSDITRERIEELCGLLRRAPQNATQRYPGLTLQQAIEAADKAKDTRRLKPTTLSNYFNNLTTIFNFAVDEGMMAENPTKGKRLRNRFREESGGPKAQFSIDDLNAMFRAPLFTGCVDDENGYARPGPNQPRRGRFWVPLLALFHGLRCNEACQLYTEDVKERHGVWFLHIREERENGDVCEKRLKTEQSKREVPIHPEVMSIGFLAFVAERRKDVSSPRLFPDLALGKTGYYSNPFSKFFGRFVASVLGEHHQATFHSFRHQFRDATRAARLSIETVALLGGWEDGKGSRHLTMNHYGRGSEFLRILRDDISRISYPGLTIEHLRKSI